MASRLSFFIVALAVLLPVTSAATTWGRIRAATFYQGNLILFKQDGQPVYPTNPEGQNVMVTPTAFVMTAASCILSYYTFGPICAFYGDEQIQYGGQHVTYANKDDFYYRNMFPDFVWHGLDAAIQTTGDAYFFKGCNYVTKDATNTWDLTVRNVADLKVPCDVDAGWFDGTNAVVLKGNTVWYVGRDQSMTLNEYLSD